MNLSQLNYFKKLAEVLHYTRAAQELFITQPTLSGAISSLEKELGAPLFERNGRSMALTTYGEVFYEHVCLALRAIDDLRRFADAGGGVLLITHDIELALRCADRVAIFHDGTVVEETSTASFVSPDLLAHPFSKALWHALPEHDFFSSPDIRSKRG